MKQNNKKIFNYLTSIILCAIVLISLCTFFMPSHSVKADTLTDEIADNQPIAYGFNYENPYILDRNLYDALLNIANELHSGDSTRDGSVFYAGDFKTLETLNLSNKNIESLTGLSYLKFNNLKTLNLSNNKIQYLADNLSQMTNLEDINISNNKITSFNSTFSNHLTSVNLKNNKLTNINLSTLCENAVVDLSYNLLESYENITLPTNDIEVYLTHNGLVEEKPTAITSTLHLGFQGILNNSVLQSTQIRFYGLENVNNISVYKIENQVETLLNSYNNITGLDIPTFNIGKYKIVFNESVSEKVYADIEFTCKPYTPQVEQYKGEEKLNEVVYVTNDLMKIKLIGDGTIYYQINNGQVVAGNEIDITKSGAYTIVYWQEINGIKSDTTTLPITCKYVNPMDFVWIMLTIVFFVLFFYAGIMFKNKMSAPKSVKKENTSIKGFE